MKKLLVVLLIALLFGCSKDEKKETVATDAKYKDVLGKLESYDDDVADLNLLYKFKKGDKFSFKLTTISSTNAVIEADSTIKADSKETTYYTFDFEVLNKKGAEYDLNVNIKAIAINAEMNGQKFDFDSKKQYTPEEKQQFLQYTVLIDHPYKIVMDQSGEIKDVTGLEKMVDEMLAVQAKGQKVPPEQRLGLIENFEQGAIKPMTQLVFRKLPVHQINKDSVWTDEYPGSIGVFQLKNKVNFKLEDFVKNGDNKAAVISAKLSVSWEGKNKGTQDGIDFEYKNPVISGDGIILFDVDRGIVKKSDTGTGLELSVSMQAKDSTGKIKKTTRTEKTMNRNIVELL